jgi:hypothetical protein
MPVEREAGPEAWVARSRLDRRLDKQDHDADLVLCGDRVSTCLNKVVAPREDMRVFGAGESKLFTVSQVPSYAELGNSLDRGLAEVVR